MTTILVIEDDSELLLGLKDNLELEGYNVVTAPDGDVGLTKAEVATPDAVILDVMLPTISGFDVCRRLKERGQDVPIPFLPVEADFWKKNYNKRPYYVQGKPYEEYEPGYRYGWETASRPEFKGRGFNEVESDLEKGWDRTEYAAGRSWRDVKDATRDAYDRIRS